MYKNKWIAAILSFILPGLGHLYLGFTRIAFFVIFFLLFIELLFSNSKNSFDIIIPITIIILLKIFTTFYCFKKKVIIESIKSSTKIHSLQFCLLILVSFIVINNMIPNREYFRFSALSGSMEPTILVSDSVIAHYLKNEKIKRGEIIIFKFPGKKDYFFKRVIGLPGDTVEIIGKTIFVNGKKLNLVKIKKEKSIVSQMSLIFSKYNLEIFEEYSNDKSYLVAYRKNIEKNRNLEKIYVPEKHYFVVGDNRDFSIDSRKWRMIPKKFIFAKGSFILFSTDYNRFFDRFNLSL